MLLAIELWQGITGVAIVLGLLVLALYVMHKGGRFRLRWRGLMVDADAKSSGGGTGPDAKATAEAEGASSVTDSEVDAAGKARAGIKAKDRSTVSGVKVRASSGERK